MATEKSDTVASSPLFKDLCASVATETLQFTFACGGSIPIVHSLPTAEQITNNTETRITLEELLKKRKFVLSPILDRKIFPDPSGENFNKPETRSTSSLLIDLRWDSKDSAIPGHQTKVSFPITPETEDNLLRLVADCDPATFGLGNKNVLDVSYRRASKMDPSQFSSTFNPYEVGIVDTVAQALLPTLIPRRQTRSLKAELYKLNVYSAPSGKFKPHVDTPRSSAQVGSLVVCLPLSHKGGTLEVRHRGKTVAFNWGELASGPAIQWAAFYSDCEHEVLEVTEGHRLTLTYNLYVVRGNGFLGGHSPALNPTTLPLYKTIHDLVKETGLWTEQQQRSRNFIGYHCSHIYPHAAESRLHFYVPDNLKGADLAMYSIFSNLGLKVSFRPAFHGDNTGYGDVDSDDSDSQSQDSGHRHKRRKTTRVELGPVEGLEFAEFDGGEEGVKDEFDSWTGKSIGDHVRKPDYLRYRNVQWVNDTGHKERAATYLAVTLGLLLLCSFYRRYD